LQLSWLVFVVGAIFSKGVSAAGPPQDFARISWGAWSGASVSLSVGPTGYAINPARDLGPRIAHAILPIAGKGGSDWGLPDSLIGPLIGGVLAGVLLRVLAIPDTRQKAGTTPLTLGNDSAPSGEPARTLESAAKKEPQNNEFGAIPVAGCVAESMASRPPPDNFISSITVPRHSRIQC